MLFSRYTNGGLLVCACIAMAACDGGGGGITQPQTGTVEVTISTTGRVLDRDGYSVTVGGTAPMQATANGTATVSQVAAGAHTVTLGGVAENCQAQGGASTTVNVTAGGTAQASFAVVCQANRVAYVAPEAGGYALFTERVDGTDRLRLAGPVALSRIAWSPDGHRIAYTAPAAGTSAGGQVWVVDVGSGATTQLTTARFLNTEPAWSPDGTTIVFRSQAQGFANCDLWMMGADGSNQRAVTQTAGFGLCLTFPEWSPDGTKIEFVTRGSAGSSRLQWMDPAATTFGQAPENAPAPSSGGASWSPGSSRVAFSSVEQGGNGLASAVYTSVYDGTDARRVAVAPGFTDSGIAWVNATTLAYTVRIPAGGESTYELWTIGADGTGLTRSPVGAGQSPMWPRWQ